MTLMPEHYKELEKLFKIAKMNAADKFLFRGTWMDTNYVKYLLEYIKGQIK